MGRDPNLFRESVLAGLGKDFMRIHHTSVIKCISDSNVCKLDRLYWHCNVTEMK